METIRLENKCFSALISSRGAELKSLVEKETGTEYIWNGDPVWWTGSAPVLFPIVGRLKNSEYIYEGKTYSLPQHGMARTSQFSVSQTNREEAVFTLESCENSRKMYPFDFTLIVTFRMEPSGLSIQYDVINRNKKNMFFSIGSHPAFNIPFAGGVLEDYYVQFSEDENIPRYKIEDGLITDKTGQILSENGKIPLNETLFDEDALVFKNPLSTEFYIKNINNTKAIRVSTGSIPYLGIWAKPGRAPFLCIEPWYGLADRSDTDKDFEHKEGVVCLKSGEIHSSSYKIEALQD